MINSSTPPMSPTSHTMQGQRKNKPGYQQNQVKSDNSRNTYQRGDKDLESQIGKKTN